MLSRSEIDRKCSKPCNGICDMPSGHGGPCRSSNGYVLSPAPTAQFKNKAEARAAIADMAKRADTARARATQCIDGSLPGSAAGFYSDERAYRAEAASITALLHTLPE